MAYLNPKTVPVPSGDSAANSYPQDVIGNKTDTVSGDSLVALVKILQADLDNGTDGLSALKALIDAVPTVGEIQTEMEENAASLLDTIRDDLGNATDGLGALKDLIDANQTDLNAVIVDTTSIETKVDTVDTVADGIQADLSNATDGLGALKALIDTADTVIDNVENHLDGTTATVTAYRREYGVTQVKEVSVTAAANAAVTTVATITTQPCLMKSVVIHADAAQTADMTSCAVKGGTNQVVEFISAVTAVQASLDAADKQVSWTGAVRLAAAETISIDLQGTGATAVDLTIVIEYMSCVDGGYLA